MNRLFDINLKNNGWTEGEVWSDCNPVQKLPAIYIRKYGDSPEDEPNYRLEDGDNFFIGSPRDAVKDWTPKQTPWAFTLDGAEIGEISFYFGVQSGESDIDTLAPHAPYIVNLPSTFIFLVANYHRFYGAKLKNCHSFMTVLQDLTGITIEGAVLKNTNFILNTIHQMFDWVIRKIVIIGSNIKSLFIPVASRNVSVQDMTVSGFGDCGIAIEAGHSDMKLISILIDNENHRFNDERNLFHGVHVEAGSIAYVRFVEINGFSGNAFIFDCPVDVRNLSSDKCGAGIYFGDVSSARNCMIMYTRQLVGDSYAYYAAADVVLNNCGCNLDETGGLGVIVGEEGVVVTINGGDYWAKLPLPFLHAVGTCKFILNKVTINGTVYNETVELGTGESWRGVKAQVTLDPIPVYANKSLTLPYMHIPELVSAKSIQGSNRPFNSQMDLPSGARIVPTKYGTMRYMPLDAWLHLEPGEVAVDYFRYSNDVSIYTHQFEIHASPEVGPKVVEPDSFTGNNWNYDSGFYSVSTAINNSLSSSYSFEENEVYQISLKISNLASGSVKPAIGNQQAEYSHTSNGTTVWLIRAPSSASNVQIIPNSFKGDISNIFVRKLIRNETPAVPELSAEVSGNSVSMTFNVLPVARLRDRFNAHIKIRNQELNQNAESGYLLRDSSKHYLFENVWATGKRKAISLYGAKSLEVQGGRFIGGFTGTNDTWQVGIQADLSSDLAEIQQIYFCEIDLLLDSNHGDYNSQFGNSDCVVINNTYTSDEIVLFSAHLYGNDMKNGSDSVTDLKKRSEVVNCRYEHSCKMLRTHLYGSAIVANSEFVRGSGTREVFSPTHSSPFIEIWNSMVDGVRCVSSEQLQNQPKGFGDYINSNPVRNLGKLVHVLNTYPTLDDLNRAAMTDMEFQISDNNGATWRPLSVPNVGLPGVVGCFKRTINFSSGTYKIRCRCLNGARVGAWSNTISITV